MSARSGAVSERGAGGAWGGESVGEGGAHSQREGAPLLVLQGDNDPRVPKEEAQQVVDILKKEGRVVDVHYYPNEGHGFVKRENQIDSIRRTIAWFDQYLMGTSLSP